jgi:pyruvate dehydrogenase complex dehydrogenase (E1) component
LEEHLKRHHHISKDIYWAFQKYMDEGEEPAFIIADLIKMKNQSEES